jgi:hypothetical protein
LKRFGHGRNAVAGKAMTLFDDLSRQILEWSQNSLLREERQILTKVSHNMDRLLDRW